MNKKKIDALMQELNRQNKVAVAFDCEVTCIYSRRDGFSKLEKRKYEYLTREQFYYLVKRPVCMLAMPKLQFATRVDDALPAYVDNYKYEFFPKSFKWNTNKTKLAVFYEDK